MTTNRKIDDAINYKALIVDSLHAVIKRALEIRASQHDSKNAIYIAFDTAYIGVQMPLELINKNEREMVIVLEHEFKNLAVNDKQFSVVLTFGGFEALFTIPFSAINAFFDASADLMLNIASFQSANRCFMADLSAIADDGESLKANDIIEIRESNEHEGSIMGESDSSEVKPSTATISHDIGTNIKKTKNHKKISLDNIKNNKLNNSNGATVKSRETFGLMSFIDSLEQTIQARKLKEKQQNDLHTSNNHLSSDQSAQRGNGSDSNEQLSEKMIAIRKIIREGTDAEIDKMVEEELLKILHTISEIRDFDEDNQDMDYYPDDEVIETLFEDNDIGFEDDNIIDTTGITGSKRGNADYKQKDKKNNNKNNHNKARGGKVASDITPSDNESSTTSQESLATSSKIVDIATLRNNHKVREKDYEKMSNHEDKKNTQNKKISNKEQKTIKTHRVKNSTKQNASKSVARSDAESRIGKKQSNKNKAVTAKPGRNDDVAQSSIQSDKSNNRNTAQRANNKINSADKINDANINNNKDNDKNGKSTKK